MSLNARSARSLLHALVWVFVFGAGAQGARAATPGVEVGPSLVETSQALSGDVTIATVFPTAVPQLGELDLSTDPVSGQATGRLRFDVSSGRLPGWTFLSLRARMEIVPAGKSFGTFVDGKLELTQLLRFKLTKGWYDAASLPGDGNFCQTKHYSVVKLRSTEPVYDQELGGPLEATFSISDFNGCRPLQGLVDPLIAGDGHEMKLVVAPSEG